MMLRKILLAAGAATLMAAPALAAPPAGPHGAPDGHGNGGQHGKPHRCVAHKVGYVAAGTLVSQTLVLDPTATPDHPTYSGDVTIAVTRTNHAARGDKGTTKTYTLVKARVVLGLTDQNADGRVDLGDLAAGDRVKVIGKVTTLRRRCDQTGFTATTTIRQLVVHAPAQQHPAGS